MKILVLNGSPRSENSNTMILTRQFIEGLNDITDNDIQFIDISKKNIEHCLGCFACWKEAPYRCIIKDDAGAILKMMVNSDLIIWSFPLFHYNVPSKMKALLDRTLPIDSLFSNLRKGNYYGILADKTKHIIISTCGNVDKNSYLSVTEMFNQSYGKENLEHIYLIGGETIKSLTDFVPLQKYLDTVKIAGQEYVQYGNFSSQTKKILKKGIFDDETFCVEQWLHE